MHALALLLLCYCNCYDEVCILTLVVEAVDTVDRGTLMVASQYEEVLWVLNLVGQQQADCL
jgi:hypothetical protein